jgi:hypothetical protein
VRDAVRRRKDDLLSGIVLLGANYRTLALGASMLAGSPVYFFVYEAVALNLVLLHSISRIREATAAILEEISS